MGDVEGALKSFRWFEKEFPDDIGDPGQYLCWSLALYRASLVPEASRRLTETALQNLYVIPHLLGETKEKLGIWHSSNLQWPSYVGEIPPEYFQLWSDDEREWARRVSAAPEFGALIGRWTEIHAELMDLPPGDRRSALVDEAWALRRGLASEHP